MAKGVITEKDIISKEALNWGGKYAKTVQEAIAVNEKFIESAKKYNEISNQYKGVANFKEYKAVKEQEIALSQKTEKLLLQESKTRTQLQRERKAAIDTETKELALKNKLQAAQNKSVKLTIQERVALQANNKVLKLQAREQLGLVGAYEALNRKRSEAQTKLANLLATDKKDITNQKKHQQELAKTRAKYTELNSRIKAVDNATNNYTKNIGNYKSAITGLTGTFRSMVSALGLTTGVYAFFQVMKNGIKIIRDYEKQNATLSGILQVEKEDMKALTTESARLGETTVKTAGEVTELQIAYARLGFSQQEIIDMTESTIQGSIAMNAELGATANLVGAVVNTFDDLGSTDAPKILDIMSLATAKSALNFQKLETGLPIVSGAANAAGVPFTKLVALMGKLSDSGIDVSSSSTALRNIFIESAAQGLNYSEIIQKIKDSQDKLTSSNDEFGKRAAVSATVLAQNIDATEELDLALQNAAGTAENMANKELDTLDGALQLLKSAWQGIIIGTNDANSASDKLKKAIKYLADNLKQIVDFIVKAGKAWLIYKAILVSVSLATRAYTAVTLALRVAKIALTGGLSKATKAMKLFNVAAASNPIGALVAVLATAVAVFVAFKDGANSAAEAQRALNDAVEEGKKSAEEYKELSNARIQEEIDLIKEKARERIAATKNEKEITEINKNAINEQINLYVKEKNAIEQRVIAYANQSAQYAADSPERAKFNTLITEETNNLNELSKRIRSLTIDKKEINKENIKETQLTEKQIEALRKKREQDAYNLSKFRLEEEIKLQEELISDEKASFEDRLNAIVDLEEAKRKLSDLTKDYLIKNVQKGSDEETLILEKAAAEKEQIRKNAEVNTGKLYLARLKQLKDFEEEEKKLLGVGTIELQNKLESGLISVEEYEIKLSELRFNSSKTMLLNQIDFLEKELLNHAYTAEQKAAIEEELGKKRTAISNLTTKQLIADKKEELEERLELEKKLEDIRLNFISETSYAIGEYFDVDGAKIAYFFDTVTAKTKDWAEIAKASIGLVAEIGNAIFERNIENIDAEITASDEQYEKKIENAEGDENKQKILEQEKEKRRLALEAQKRKEQVKQAKFNKAAAALNITVSTAQAILGALAQVPKFDFGISAGLLAASYGAIGAIQLGAVLATPIPKYKHGRKGGKAEFAEVGDGYVHEVVENPDGSAYLTPNRPTLTYLEKNANVHSSFDDYLATKQPDIDLFKITALANLESQGRNVTDYQQKVIVNNKINEQLLQKAILDSGKSIESNVLKAINKSLLGAKTVNNITIDQPTTYTKF